MSEEETIDEITQFTTAYLDHINTINQYLPRIRNIEYNTQTNTTSIYGHTNFQELKVNNVNVSLNGHAHLTTDINQLYEEEEEFQEEEEGVMITKTRTVNKTKPLDTILDSKANNDHNHTTNDITNWSTATSNFVKTNANNTLSGNITMTYYSPKIDMVGGVSGELSMKCAGIDYMRIYAGTITSGNGFLEIVSSCSGNEPIYVRQYQYSDPNYCGTITHEAVLLDASGNTSFPGTLSTPAITLNGDDLATTLDGKAASVHDHLLSEVTFLMNTQENYTLSTNQVDQ